MKLLHINNFLGLGGAETLLAETLPRYAKRGIDVELLVLNGTNTPLIEKLSHAGIKVNYLSFGSYYDPRHIIKLISYIKKFEVVHVHLFPPLYFAALAKMLTFSRTILVFTEHSTSNRRLQQRLFKIPDKLIYSVYNKVVCITEDVKKVLASYLRFHDEKFIVIENGIDANKFTYAVPHNRKEIAVGLSESDFVITQVSGFRIGKDQKTLIESLKYLPDSVKILLIGDGVTREEHEDLAKTLNFSKRVFFLGWRSDIPQILQSSDLTVLASHFEGMSLACLEGMASGKPFLGSDVPGINNSVKEYGILFPDGDAEAFAEEVRKLMSDKNYYKQISERCIERARQYDISIMVDKHIALYQKLLSKK